MSSFDHLYRYKAIRINGVIFCDRAMHSDALAVAMTVYSEADIDKAFDDGTAQFGFVYMERYDYCSVAMSIEHRWHGLKSTYQPCDGGYDAPSGAYRYNDPLPAMR